MIMSPFPLYAVPRIYLWMRQNWDKVADDSTPADVNAFVEDWLRRERGGQKSWAVLKDGELGGVITSERISDIVADLHCTFRREFWGRGNTVPALALACAEIFGSAVEKITSLVYPDNRAMIGMAIANGAIKEGHLHRQVRKNGELVDLLLLGLTKENFLGSQNRLQQSKQQLQQHQHDHEKPDSVPDSDPAEHLQDYQRLHEQPADGGSSLSASGA